MKKGYLIDMDGVIYRGSAVIPGAVEFVHFLRDADTPYLFLTKNSTYTAQDVVAKMKKLGIETAKDHVYTSAMATAQFVARQKPHGTAFVIGEGGLLNALAEVDYAISRDAADLGYESVLVLTGSTTLEDLKQFPFQPTRVVKSIAEVLPEKAEEKPARRPRASAA